MRWLYFLQGDTNARLDPDSLVRGVNAQRYEEPPPARAPQNGGTVSGMAERDRIMKALFEENYELKLCVGSLVQLLVSKQVVALGDIKETVDQLARGQHPFGFFRQDAPSADDPWNHLR